MVSGNSNEVDWWLQTDVEPLYVKWRLDQISCGGDIKLGILKQAPVYKIVNWVGYAIRVCDHDETFRHEVLKELETGVRLALEELHAKDSGRCNGMEPGELIDLVLWKIFRTLEQDERYTEVCQLFKIPKDDHVARLIMSAKAANLRSNPSPPFKLATCEEIRRRITELGPCWFVSADLRHFFYQIKICKSFQRLLVVLGRNGEKYAPCVLPMGHSWSPFLAQSICWGIILLNATHGRTGAGSCGDPYESGDCYLDIPETVPDFITIRRKWDQSVVGFITVYYDNVLVVCKDREQADLWKRKLYVNANHCEAKWKKPKGAKSAILGPDRFVDYIGVYYEWEGETLHWYWPKKSMKTFDEDHPMFEDASKWSPREVYSWIGTRQWKARIAEDPFFRIHDAMMLIGVIQEIARDRSWDAELTEQEFAEMRPTLVAMRAEILTHQEMKRVWEADARREVFVVVDAATSKGMAALWFNLLGQEISAWRDGYSIEERRVKRIATQVEIRAIAEAVERTTARGVIIRLASDCMAAMQAIKKGWSKSPPMLACIKRVYAALEANDNKLSMVHIKGKDNYADFHSRWQGVGLGETLPKEFKTVGKFLAENERRRARPWEVLVGSAEVLWQAKNKGF